ncbi:MAG: PEP-utilizing enzyme [Blastocatellia bacterium]|nr:PEP-utilizing enzyme [Blastocatellia bacterium]
MTANRATRPEIVLRGLGVSPGVGWGPAVHLPRRGRLVFRRSLAPHEVDAEVARFQTAVAVAREQLQALRQRMEHALGREHAYILDAQRLMLEDAGILGEIETLIRTNAINAEWAVKLVTDRILAIYAEIKDDYLRERGSDIEDVAHRLLTVLVGERDAYAFPEGAVLVGETLPPSLLGELDPQRVAGLVIGTGGWTSHAAILARGLGIPAVSGIHGALALIENQALLLVDGTQGLVFVHPAQEVIRRYEEQQKERERRWLLLRERAPLPTTTSDGVSIIVRANIERLSELEDARHFGACGIGLLRTEFLFLQAAPELPSEEMQWRAYRQVAEAAGPEGAVIRTVDWDENQMAALGSYRALRDEPLVRTGIDDWGPWIHERNPALGLRAIRFSLNRPQVLRTQLRAIVRAAAFGNLRIVLPLITRVEEVHEARHVLDAVCRELRAEGFEVPDRLPLGVMIETPAAVWLVEELATAADFLSLGTNDLIQYILAVDRDNDRVAHLYDPLHPAVLRAVHHVMRAAERAGLDLEVCGEMAAHPLHALVLLGLGVRILSMRPRAIPLIRDLIRQCELARVRDLAQKALTASRGIEVRQLVLRGLEEMHLEVFDEALLNGSAPPPRDPQ